MNINLTLIGQMIAFVCFVMFCMKYVWPPILAAMAERERKIADGLAADGGPESVEGAGGGGGGSGSAGSESSALAAGLVEPDLDVSLPVLSEVHVGEHVIMLNHCQSQTNI